jgi:hypothetical protein
MGLSLFSSVLTKLTFKYMLCKRAYSREQLQEMASQTAFKTCEIREDSIGYEVTLGK